MCVVIFHASASRSKLQQDYQLTCTLAICFILHLCRKKTADDSLAWLTQGLKI